MFKGNICNLLLLLNLALPGLEYRLNSRLKPTCSVTSLNDASVVQHVMAFFLFYLLIFLIFFLICSEFCHTLK